MVSSRRRKRLEAEKAWLQRVHERPLKTVSNVDYDFVEQLTFSRFEHRCVVTNQRDMGKVRIAYKPKFAKCIELVSLRDYLYSFTHLRMSTEDVACTIRNTIENSIDPAWGVVVLQENPRGYMKFVAEVVATIGDPPPYQRFFWKKPKRTI